MARRRKGRGKGEEGFKAFAMNPDVNQETACIGIAIKIEPEEQSVAELEARVAKLLDEVKALLDRPEFKGFSLCEHGEEAMKALALAALGHQRIAEAIAAKKARNN